MRQSEFRRLLQQQEKRRQMEQKRKDEAREMSWWRALKAAKRWIMFLVINSILTNNRK